MPAQASPAATKDCTKCKQSLPFDSFHKNKRNSGGLAYNCKACRRAYYEKNRHREIERALRHWVKNSYGLTLNRYQEMIVAGCTVCGQTEGRIVMDHCHASGAVRGALCDRCNFALGTAYDNPETLRRAADYLERHHASTGRQTSPSKASGQESRTRS